MSAGLNSIRNPLMAQRIQSFRDIASQYDVVLCDVWGVLHNGVEAFAYASEALAEARAAGLTVVLITNSPRPHPGVKVQVIGTGPGDAGSNKIIEKLTAQKASGASSWDIDVAVVHQTSATVA